MNNLLHGQLSRRTSACPKILDRKDTTSSQIVHYLLYFSFFPSSFIDHHSWYLNWFSSFIKLYSSLQRVSQYYCFPYLRMNISQHYEISPLSNLSSLCVSAALDPRVIVSAIKSIRHPLPPPHLFVVPVSQLLIASLKRLHWRGLASRPVGMRFHGLDALSLSLLKMTGIVADKKQNSKRFSLNFCGYKHKQLKGEFISFKRSRFKLVHSFARSCRTFYDSLGSRFDDRYLWTS